MASDELLGRIDHQLERGNELMERNRDAFGALQRQIDEQTKQLAENTDQIRANTRATWRMLDRLGPPQPEG